MPKIITIFIMLLISTLSFAQIAPNYETALTMSANEKKPIMVTVISTTCPWCKKLKNEIFANPTVAKRMQDQFITLIINKDTDKIPQGLNAKVVPTTFFINSKGVKISQSAIGFFEATDFNDFLTEALNNSSKL